MSRFGVLDELSATLRAVVGASAVGAPVVGAPVVGAPVAADVAGPDVAGPVRLDHVVRGLADDDVLELLLRVEGLARQVEAVRVAAVAEVADRSRRTLGAEGLAQRHGCRTDRELVQRLTGAAGVTVGRWKRLASALRAQSRLDGSLVPGPFEQVAAALDEGCLPVDAAAAIVDELRPTLRTAPPEAVDAACSELVAAARVRRFELPALDADSVRVQAQAWAAFLDPDGAPPDEVDCARRFLTLTPGRGGLVRLRGLLLPEVAQTLHAFADACTNPRVHDDIPDHSTHLTLATDPDVPGAGVPDADPAATTHDDVFSADDRSRAQVLHDVLACALQAAARASGQRSVAGNSPTLVVAVREQDLAQRRGNATTLGGDGARLGVDVAARLACTADVQRVVLGEQGRVLGIWSPERCFTGHQRRAIALRDGGCVIPGCHVPASWCEVHHVTPHAHDPAGTTTDNGVLLCWHHHRTLDTSGWQLRMHDGIPQIRPPSRLRRLAGRGAPPGERHHDHHDDGWRPATGSPARILDTLARLRSGAPPGNQSAA